MQLATGLGHRDTSARQPDSGVDQPDSGVEQPDTSVGQPGTIVRLPDTSVSSLTLLPGSLIPVLCGHMQVPSSLMQV